MRSGFFQSKPFWVAVVVACLVFVGAAYAFSVSSNPETRVRTTSCASSAPTGFAEPGNGTDTGAQSDGFRVSRKVTYTIDASALQNGTAYLCVTYGDIEVQPSLDGNARIIFDVHGWGPGSETAVAATKVEAFTRTTSEGLEIRAWQATHAETSRFFDTDGSSVSAVLELPPSAHWRLSIDTAYGDVSVVRVPISGTIETRYGDIEVRDVDLKGALDIDTSYGDVDFRAISLVSGRIVTTSSYGDIAMRLPTLANAGYDVDAKTEYGEASVRIGETDFYSANKDRESVRATSKGYASKAIQVTIRAETSYGDVDVDLG